MKTFLPFKFRLVFILSCIVTFLNAQVLEEIPNPDNLTYYFFNGGSDQNLFFDYLGGSSQTRTYHYDGIGLNLVPISDNDPLSFYSHEYAGLYYFVDDSNFSDPTVYEFDGTNASIVSLPTDYQYESFLSNFAGNMYIILRGPDFKRALFQYDGNDFVEIARPPGLFIKDYIGTVDDHMYLAFDSIGILRQLFSFDGTTLASVSDLPEDHNHFTIAFSDSDDLILQVLDDEYTPINYKLAANNAIEIPNPQNSVPQQVLGKNADNGDLYLTYIENSVLPLPLYVYNGNELTQILQPTDRRDIRFSNSLNGTAYVTMKEVINVDRLLYKVGTTSLEPVITPEEGYSFLYYVGMVNEEAYYIFRDPFFNNVLMKLDQNTNSLSALSAPAGFTLNSYLEVFEETLLLVYFDQTIKETLFLYDGVNLNEIENPGTKDIASFETEDHGVIYLRYNDPENFGKGTLYKLDLNQIDPNNTIENKLNASTIIYPIPASNSMTIKLESEKVLEKISISILSNSGQIISQKYYNGIGNIFEKTIDTSTLESGSYYIYGKTPIGSFTKQLVLIQ